MVKKRITEDDLLYIFSAKERRQRSLNTILKVTKKIFLGLVFASVVFLIINMSAYYHKISYWYKTEFKSPIAPEMEEYVPKKEEPKPVRQVFVPKMAENEIKIPALDLTAPILWRVNNVASDVSKSLESGVIHINGTAFPGEAGNVYITGHSSNFVWARGNYNSIFALLDKLVIGDKIYVKYSSQVYIYEVFDKSIVMPTDVSLLAQTEDSRLTLVTCWPVGTNIQRLALFARQVHPDPKKNIRSKEKVETNHLPATR